jgi:hypothetical protein
MPGLVYLLCAVTSLASALLLFRGAILRSAGNWLLFWSAICFFGMALNNILMYVNVLTPTINMVPWPNVVALASILILNLALIWHTT